MAPRGTLTRFDGLLIATWMRSRLQWAREHGWTGHVVSGYRSYGEQLQLFEEFQAGRRRGPVAPPGQSNHQGLRYPRGAVDVTDAVGLERAMARWPGKGQRLHNHVPGDRVHFSATGY